MKKLLVTTFLVSVTCLVQAQVQYGVKAGLNLAKEQFSSDAFTTSPRIGFHAGFAGRYAFLEQLAFQAELILSLEGTKEKHSQGTKGQISRMYLHLPLVVQYMIARNLQAEAGLQVGYMMSAKESYGGSDNNDILEYYKKADLRWLIGLAYSLNQQLILNARFTRGLSHINKVQVGGNELRSMVMYLSLLYFLK